MKLTFSFLKKKKSCCPYEHLEAITNHIYNLIDDRSKDKYRCKELAENYEERLNKLGEALKKVLEVLEKVRQG